MKLGRMMGLAVVAVVLLFVTATYVQYSDQASLMKTRGVWTVDVSGGVFLAGGTLSASLSNFRAQYNAYPEIPTFGEYLGDKFGGGNKQGAIPANDTFVKMRVVVSVKGEGGYEKTLLDKTTNVPYTWAGGQMGENGLIGSFAYSLGPYVAYYEFSPFKITTKILVDGAQKAVETFYLSIPEPEMQTETLSNWGMEDG
jgi:hypothetical protein